MKIGVNTFGLKYELEKDFDGAMKRVKEKGFTAIEICSVPDFLAAEEEKKIPAEKLEEYRNSPVAKVFLPFSKAAEQVERFRAAGFIVDTAHVNMPKEPDAEALEKFVAETAAFSRRTGIRYFVTSPMTGLEGMKKAAPALQEAAAALKKQAVFLMIHNHDVECHEEEETTAIEYAMEHCPDLYAEPDTGWMVYGGMDPVPFMEKYGSRIIHLHLKDFKKDWDPEDKGEGRFAAIGEGILPLKEVLEAKKYCSVTVNGLIIDQDASIGDYIEDLGTGYENVKKSFA